MMKPNNIKFRGKSKHTGEWLYGDLVRNVEGAFAVVPPFGMTMENFCDRYEVDKNTISKFVGVYDKSEREIYEGDILLIDETKYVVYWDEDTSSYKIIQKILYNRTYMSEMSIPVCWNAMSYYALIIGNIYDD